MPHGNKNASRKIRKTYLTSFFRKNKNASISIFSCSPCMPHGNKNASRKIKKHIVGNCIRVSKFINAQLV
jgi:hypothetical protein